MNYEEEKAKEESQYLVPGYKYLVQVPQRCAGRVTIAGHRLEPSHLANFSKEEIKEIWNLPSEVIQECFQYLEGCKS